MFVNRPPDEVLENEGGNLYLNCSVAGADDTIVAWYRQGIPDTIVVREMNVLCSLSCMILREFMAI